MTNTTIASQLIVDMDLYPRQKVNRYHVNSLAEALKAGSELPPVVADRKTKTVTDGFHRIEAWIKTEGAAVEIPVIWKDYKEKAEMFKDSVALNATHGKAFTVFDLGRILVKAETDYKMQIDHVCRYLQITPYKAEKILKRVKPIKRGRKKKDRVYVKQGMTKLRNADFITEVQAGINDHALGVAPLRLVNDLLAKIEGNCLLYTADFLYALEKLRDAIDIVLTEHGGDADE